MKPILTQYATLQQYVLKYASKAESRSLAFSEVLDQALRNDNPNDPSIKAFQKLLIHTVGERDYSAQETCHLLLQIPLYHSSRNFASLNLNKEANRWLHDSEHNENNEVKKTDPSPLQRYCSRSTELSDVSLFRLYLQYKLVRGEWVKCSKENIVRIWPRPSPIKNGPQWEEFCRVKVLLHVCYRDILSLTENHTLSWIDLYNRHLSEINDDPSDLIGPAVDNLEEVDGNDSDDDEDIVQEEYESRADWMVLSGMMPDRRKCNSTNSFGNRDIDINHDWVGES